MQGLPRETPVTFAASSPQEVQHAMSLVAMARQLGFRDIHVDSSWSQDASSPALALINN